jgi:hypothetical protein
LNNNLGFEERQERLEKVKKKRQQQKASVMEVKKEQKGGVYRHR